MIYERFLLVLLLQVAKDLFAFELLCPDSSQRHLRREGLCHTVDSTSSHYVCLVDANRNNTFRESCAEKPDVVRPGHKYVFRMTTTAEECSIERFQPFRFHLTMDTLCIFSKSLCNDIGQVLSSNGTGLDDRSCRCDSNKGYAYITNPVDICNCRPLDEDCSCYEKRCPEGTFLTSGYQCTRENDTASYQACQVDIDSYLPAVPSSTTKEYIIEAKLQLIINSVYGLLTVGLLLAFVIILIPIVYKVASYFCKKIDYCDMERKIVENWKEIKLNLDPCNLIPVLIKGGIINKKYEVDLINQSTDDKKESVLTYMVLSSQVTANSKLHNIIKHNVRNFTKLKEKDVRVTQWPRIDIGSCKKLLSANKERIKVHLSSDDVIAIMADFLECFILNITDHIELQKYRNNKIMVVENFCQKLEAKLNEGSFECFLKALHNMRSTILLTALTTSLPSALWCRTKEVKKFKIPEAHNVAVGKLVIKVFQNEHEVDVDISSSVLRNSYWLIREFGMHPERISGSSSFSLHPLTPNCWKKLYHNYEKIVFLVDNIFSYNEVRSTLQHKNFEVECLIFRTKQQPVSNASCGKIRPNIQPDEIIFSNRSFFARNIDIISLIQDFSKLKEDWIKSINFEVIPENVARAEKLINEVEKNKKAKFFLKLLKAKIGEDHVVHKRITNFTKVYSADTNKVRNNVINRISDIININIHIEDFRSVFIERNIFTDEEINEIQGNNDQDKLLSFIIRILKSSNEDALLAFVDALYIYEFEHMASCLLSTKGQGASYADVGVMDNKIILEADDVMVSRGIYDMTYVNWDIIQEATVKLPQ